jgi:hypothetical protein
MRGEGIAIPFLTLVRDEGELSASRPFRFIPTEIAPGTHWIRGWICPRIGLGPLEKGIFLTYRDSSPGRPARSLLILSNKEH